MDEGNQSLKGVFVALAPFEEQSGDVRRVFRSLTILDPSRQFEFLSPVPASKAEGAAMTNRTWAGMVAFAVGVAVLLAVPTFAQTRDELDSTASGLSTIGIGFPSAHATSDGSGALDAIPLEVTDELRQVVHRMWRTSPTFRRQCARLLAASVRVVVRVDIRVRAKANAVTTIDVHNGFVRAVDTRLGVVQPEYLAHELEHVLEQVDGVDLRWAVKNSMAGATETRSGELETVRAIAIGRLVAQEVGPER